MYAKNCGFITFFLGRGRDSTKLYSLKRKLQADRESYQKRQKLEEDRREAKRIRERLRYQEKKLKKNQPVLKRHISPQCQAIGELPNKDYGSAEETIVEEQVFKTTICPVVANK